MNVAITSEVADAVEVCLFDDDGAEDRGSSSPSTRPTCGTASCRASVSGSATGCGCTGPWDPGERPAVQPGQAAARSPRPTAIDGEVVWGEEVFGHRFDDPNERNDDDSAASMPKCVVTDRALRLAATITRPTSRSAETVIYETHVKGFTQRHPDVPEEHPGHLRRSRRIRPSSAPDRPRRDRGRAAAGAPVRAGRPPARARACATTGATTASASSPRTAPTARPAPPAARSTSSSRWCKALHAAGLEVILDVVYNHTAEGNHLGPTLSLKGIDNPAYYRLVDEDRGQLLRHHRHRQQPQRRPSRPRSRLILDSLRYWVTDMHVDGFRFDLATTLTRQMRRASTSTARSSTSSHQDPVLAPVKMIAEPWDTAGYQVGGFPARLVGVERQVPRRRPRLLAGASRGRSATSRCASPAAATSTRRSGAPRRPASTSSPPTTGSPWPTSRRTTTSTTRPTARTTTTARSTTARGTAAPRARPTTRRVNELRARQRRNLLGTLLLSAGVPMILGGDEIGRTQQAATTTPTARTTSCPGTTGTTPMSTCSPSPARCWPCATRAPRYGPATTCAAPRADPRRWCSTAPTASR